MYGPPECYECLDLSNKKKKVMRMETERREYFDKRFKLLMRPYKKRIDALEKLCSTLRKNAEKNTPSAPTGEPGYVE